MNKKLHTLFVLLAVTCCTALAQSPRQQRAWERASRFVQSQAVMPQPEAQPTKSPLRRGDGSNAGLYVFNAADGKGFVVVADDGADMPVLGYSTGGAYDAGNLAPAFEEWMQSMEQQVIAVSEGRATPYRVTANYGSIAPLIQTQWNQGQATAAGQWYNTTCPTINGKRCLTGCVATATAQLMFYYRHPTEATLEVPGYTYSGSAADTSEPLPPVVFDWAHMTTTYSNSSSAQSVKAVSTLMRYCGQAAHMNYGLTASSASNWIAAENAVNYFDYDPYTWNCLVRDYYTAAEWDSLMYDELKAGRPVLYSGQKATPNNGHAFLLDGYNKSNGMWHFNMGWGGYQDGYYVMSYANEYSYDQDACTGLQPRTGSVPAQPHIVVVDHDVTPTTRPTFHFTLKNTGSATFNHKLLCDLYEINDNGYDYLDIPSYTAGFIKIEPGETKEYEVALTGLTEGKNYYVVFTTKGIGYRSEWLEDYAFQARGRWNLDLTQWTLKPYVHCTLGTTLKNDGDADFKGSLELILCAYDENEQMYYDTGEKCNTGAITIKKGKTYNLDGKFDDLCEGCKYSLVLQAYPEDGEVQVLKSETFTAKRDPVAYKLIYTIEGELYKSYDVLEDTEVTPEPAPTRSGYTFDGWVGEPAVMPSHDVTVTGSFTKKPTHTSLKVPEAGFATFYDSQIPYILPEGLQAYVAAAVSGSKLRYVTIAQADETIPAGTAVVIEATIHAAATYTLTEDVSKTPVPPYTGSNLLMGSDTRVTTSSPAARFYKLCYGNDGTYQDGVFGWYWGAPGGAAFSIEAHRAWLALPGTASLSPRFLNLPESVISFSFPNLPESETDTQDKDSDTIYDLQGRRVTTPVKGHLYIRGGKKVFIQ